MHGRFTPTRQGARAEELAVGEVCVGGARQLTPTRQGARAEELAVGEVCVRGARQAHTHSAGWEG